MSVMVDSHGELLLEGGSTMSVSRTNRAYKPPEPLGAPRLFKCEMCGEKRLTDFNDNVCGACDKTLQEDSRRLLAKYASKLHKCRSCGDLTPNHFRCQPCINVVNIAENECDYPMAQIDKPTGDGLKMCKMCRVRKDAAREFSQRISYCKPCQAQKMREHRASLKGNA